MRERAHISWIDYKWWFVFAVCTVFLSIRVGEKIQSVFYVSENPFVKGGFLFLTLVLYALAALLVYLFVFRIGKVKNLRFLIVGEMTLWLMITELFVLRHLFPRTVSHNNLLLLQSAMIGINDEKMFFDGASSLYVDVLSVLFAFLGNHEVLVYYFQFGLQILSTLLLFFVVRFLVGTISAYVTAVILALSLCFGEAVLLYQPEAVYLFLWSVAFFSLILSYQIGKMELAFSKTASFFGTAATGFLVGIASYFDLVGLLLAVTGFYLAYLTRKNLQRYILKNAFFLFGIIFGFFIMFFREAVLRNNIVSENFANWLNKFTVDFRLNANIPKENLLILIVMSMLCMALVVFFLQNSSKSLSLFTFYIFVLCAVFPMLGFATVNLSMWITFAWAAMAGLGLQSLVGYGIKMRERKVINDLVGVDDSDGDEEKREEDDERVLEIEEIEEKEMEAKDAVVAEVLEEVKDAVVAEVLEEVKDAVVTEVLEETKDTEKIKESAAKKDAGAPLAQKKTQESRYDTSTGIKYLENPLPLPAKPVRRVMDYPYAVSEDKMHYDFEVADNDDYDV